MNCAIGVDIGSSSIKAVLFADEISEVLKSERRQLTSRIATNVTGRFEEDPNLIRNQVFEALSVLCRNAKENNHEIKSIAFTGQMHGGFIVDSNLRPLTNFITWQDKRGDELAQSGKTFVEQLSEIAAQDATGAGIHTGFLITTMYWFHRTKSPILLSNDVKILGIYDWLTSILAGRAVTDISSAAAWGLYDPISRQRRSDLLAAAKIDRKMLPEIAEPGQDLGAIDSKIASQLGLDAGVRIHASIGDTQAAYIGSECTANEVLINIGTGSQSMWEITDTTPSEGTDIRYLRDGKFIACAPTLAGGEAYRIFQDFLRETIRAFSGIEMSEEEIYAIMNRIAEKSSSQGLSVDPIFQGSKFRGDLERGSIKGITTENFHPGSLIRALIEGMIEEVARAYFARVEKTVRIGLVGAGGAMRRNSVLRDVAEKRFGLPLRMGRFDDEAAIGAARLCGD